MCAQSCVVHTVSTEAECVTATRGGRAESVTYPTLTAKCRIVAAKEPAMPADVTVQPAGRDSIVNRVSSPKRRWSKK